MTLSELRAVVKQLLYEDTVHRSDAFIDKYINEGYKLTALFALFDERRGTVNVEGSRNFNPLPSTGEAFCIAPFHVSNLGTGTRVNAIRVEDLEVHKAEWEGKVESQGDALYYIMLSPYHRSVASMVLCPMQNIGRTQLRVVGAYVPSSLTATDVPRLSEQFQDLLITYAHFIGLMSEPDMAAKAQAVYVQFVTRLSELIMSQKSRFPGGRDYEPQPIEFSYLTTTELDKQQQRRDESRRAA